METTAMDKQISTPVISQEDRDELTQILRDNREITYMDLVKTVADMAHQIIRKGHETTANAQNLQYFLNLPADAMIARRIQERGSVSRQDGWDNRSLFRSGIILNPKLCLANERQQVLSAALAYGVTKDMLMQLVPAWARNADSSNPDDPAWTTVNELAQSGEISPRAFNICRMYGVFTLAELTGMTMKEMSSLRRCGTGTVHEFDTALKKRGMSFLDQSEREG